MGRNGSPGSGTASKLASRLERSQLNRMSTPGGGEVFSGAIASRALKALGARAMTVDRSIIVSDDFNMAKPEDQALLAHEQYHLNHGSGEGAAHGTDGEEAEARAVEAMVFHRASSGGYEGGYQDRGGAGAGPAWGARDQSSNTVGSGTVNADDGNGGMNAKPNAGRGYMALLAQGYNHGDVVHEMSRRAMAALDEREQVKGDRHSDKKGWG